MEYIIHLAQLLGVKPKDTVKYLVMPLGTRIKKGDLIAVKKKVFGGVSEIKSDQDGILASLSASTGDLTVTLNPVKVAPAEIKPPVKDDPVIKETHPGHSTGILGVVLSGAYGFGTRSGEAVVLDSCLDFTLITKDMKDKIIIAPSIASSAALYKANALDLAGIVVANLSKELCDSINDEFSRSVSFAFLAIGEGSQEEEKLKDKTKKYHGKKVEINGEQKELRAHP